MSYFHQDSVFWVEVDKIFPNPYQPRKEFNEEELRSLANSIRQYGVLQALVVTRKELPKADGGLSVEYELISGERRLRASKLAGVKEVPVLIREGEENDLMKLELAIIENLQREDLNVVERAQAFEKLAKEFSFTKTQIAKKVGKSREYVSNTMRVLMLPKEILEALSIGKMSEGHARPLMMLVDYPAEQQTLFKEIMYKKISVREAERIAKKIAKERVRKPGKINPEIEALEKEFTDSLGTRVNIHAGEVGGKISIDYFSQEDLHALLEVLKMYKKQGNAPMLESFLAEAEMKAKNGTEENEPEMEHSLEEEETSSQAPDSQNFENMGDTRDIEPERQQEDSSSISSPKPQAPTEPEEVLERESTQRQSSGGEENTFSQTQPPVQPTEERKEPSFNHTNDSFKPETLPEEESLTDSVSISEPKEGSGEDIQTEKKENEDDDDDIYSVRNFTL